ncbi:MAG: bS18 family ribosomal protein [Phycisphaerales bacterium]
MSRFNRFGPGGPTGKPTVTSGKGIEYVDYKDVEGLRRMMTPNGKIYEASVWGRRRGSSGWKRRRSSARFLGLLPFIAATL